MFWQFMTPREWKEDGWKVILITVLFIIFTAFLMSKA